MKETKKVESVDFDWAELETRLGESKEELGEHDYEALVTHTQELLAWIVQGDLRGQSGASRIARRIIALAWVLCPHLWGNNPSLSDLAKHLGLHKVTLSEHAASFSREFGIRNMQQRQHAHNFVS